MTVDPHEFSQALSVRWTSPDFNNHLTDELQFAWSEMADVFNKHITGQVNDKITALALPTGSGKTQGLALYCSMLSRQHSAGVLIVTNLITEANKLASLINDLSNNGAMAVAYHSDNKQSVKTIKTFPVLIITHSAFQNAIDPESNANAHRSRWDYYYEWDGGCRALTVVDEAIDITANYEITLEKIRFLCRLIPEDVGLEYQEEVSALDAVSERLEVLASEKNDEFTDRKYELVTFNGIKNIKFDALGVSLKNHATKHYQHKVLKADLSLSLNSFIGQTLNDIEKILSSWSLYDCLYGVPLFKTSRFLLPPELRSFVVLDATAAANPVTRILKQYLTIIEFPDLKTYKNMTIHTSLGHGVSGYAMGKLSKGDWSDIIGDLQQELKDKKKVLLCVHKSSESMISKSFLPDGWSIAHWGAINGLNDWGDHDAVVIYGFQRLCSSDCAVTLMAFFDWHYKIEGKEYDKNVLKVEKAYIENTYNWRHIIVAFVQAINRVHCRKMIAGGHCPKTDVYMFLDTQDDLKILTTHFKKLMPNVQFSDWTGPRVEAGANKLNSTEQLIVSFLEGSDGECIETIALIKKLDGLESNTFNNNYALQLAKQDGKLYDALKGLGWEYVSAKQAKERYGKYRKMFVKTNL